LKKSGKIRNPFFDKKLSRGEEDEQHARKISVIYG